MPYDVDREVAKLEQELADGSIDEVVFDQRMEQIQDWVRFLEEPDARTGEPPF